MDFDDFYKKKNKYQKKQSIHKYQQHNNYGRNFYSKNHGSFDPVALIESLKNNSKLKVLLIVALILVLGLVIGLIAVILPLIGSVISYVSQNGLEGLFDEAIQFLNSLWNGTK